MTSIFRVAKRVRFWNCTNKRRTKITHFHNNRFTTLTWITNYNTVYKHLLLWKCYCWRIQVIDVMEVTLEYLITRCIHIGVANYRLCRVGWVVARITSRTRQLGQRVKKVISKFLQIDNSIEWKDVRCDNSSITMGHESRNLGALSIPSVKT